MEPKVSIIIPVYKVAAWLPKCLDSCLVQTYGNIEIILVEDGSPDNCGEICDRYAKKDARVIVIHQENSGVSAARNAGLKKASGELIAFVDPDDWIEPDMVGCMVEAQLAGQYDLVICGRRVFRNQQVISESLLEKREICSRIDLLSDCLKRKSLYYLPRVWDKLYKRSIIEEFRLSFDTSLKVDEDFIFVLGYLEHTESCFYLDRALYNYQAITFDKSAQYQTADIELQWDHQIRIYEAYKNLFLNSGVYASFSGKVNKFLLYTIKVILSRTISAGCSEKAIVLKLKTIPASDIGDDLKAVHFADVDFFPEKIILICCRCRLWHLLYLCVKLRSAA